MGASVRVLLHGASAVDAEPLVGELRRAGLEPAYETVDSDAIAAHALAAGAQGAGAPVVVVRGTDTSGTISRVAATVSHELRNLILMPLVMQLELAQRHLADGNIERVSEVLASLTELSQHAVAAVDRLRQFGRQQAGLPPRHQSVRPDELAARAVDIARYHVRPRPGRTTKLEVASGGAPAIAVDPHEVIAALVNLVVNAIEALDGTGGLIRVVTGVDDRGAWIEITDNGPGMTAAVRERLFEPYFTTKGDDGTGLGLGIVDACMRRHNGTVEVITAPRAGTRFRLRFPVE